MRFALNVIYQMSDRDAVLGKAVDFGACRPRRVSIKKSPSASNDAAGSSSGSASALRRRRMREFRK